MTSDRNVNLWSRAAACAALAAAAAALPCAPPSHAAVPTGTPVFSNPTAITNRFFPFVPGGVKVFTGREEGERIALVDLYLAATRTFDWNGGQVVCRGLQETEFAAGELGEISVNWFAQADDGTVYYFGETVDDYEDGTVTGHGGSWLVGGPGPGDPAETLTVADPAVFMPANPEVGDVFHPEDLPNGELEEDIVRAVNRRVKVPAGKFTGCVEITQQDIPDGDRERKWWAPGIGFVRQSGKGAFQVLEATSFRTE